MDARNPSARIVVGVDGSPSSIDALRYAARLADALDHPLELVTTWDAPLYGEATSAVGWEPEEWTEAVQNRAIETAFGERPPRGMVKSVRVGPPARTLIEMSARAAMLVVGSRGHGGFAGLLLGSVSSACAEHAHCPVLVVHGDVDATSPEDPE